MLSSQHYVDPQISQKIKQLQTQMKHLIQTKMQIQSNTRLKPQTKQQLLKFNQNHRLQLRKIIEKCKMSMVEYFDQQVEIVTKDCISEGRRVINISGDNIQSRVNIKMNKLISNNLTKQNKQNQDQQEYSHDQLQKHKSFSTKSKASATTNNRSYITNSLIHNNSAQINDNCTSSFHCNSVNYNNHNSDQTRIYRSKSGDKTINLSQSSKQTGEGYSNYSNTNKYLHILNNPNSNNNEQVYNSIRNNIQMNNSSSQIKQINEFNITQGSNLGQYLIREDEFQNHKYSNQVNCKNKQRQTFKYVLEQQQTTTNPTSKRRISDILKRQKRCQATVAGDIHQNNLQDHSKQYKKNSQYQRSYMVNQSDEQQQQYNNSCCEQQANSQIIITLLKTKVTCLQRKCQQLSRRNTQLQLMLQCHEITINQLQHNQKRNIKDYQLSNCILHNSNVNINANMWQQQQRKHNEIFRYYEERIKQLQNLLNNKQYQVYSTSLQLTNRQSSMLNTHHHAHLEQSNIIINSSLGQNIQPPINTTIIHNTKTITQLQQMTKQLIILQSQLKKIQSENQQLKLQRKLLLKKVTIKL